MQKLRRSLFSPGERVLVAVSGGPDSLSLLHVLHHERDILGLAAIEAAHLDHGLRGAESAAEAVWVAAWCSMRGIPCHLGKTDVAARAKSQNCSKQEAARFARYEFLDTTAAALGSSKIATAHTQDDQAETVLLNILRGTGLDGLRGIPETRGRYIRPLLNVTRREIEAYCLKHGLEPRRDPSNLSPDHYTRNRVRLDLLPQLAREYNPAISRALLRLSEIAGRDRDYLHQQAEIALSDAALSIVPGKLVLKTSSLTSLHPALLRYALRRAVEQVRGSAEGIGYRPIEELCRQITERGDQNCSLTLQGLFPQPACDVLLTSGTVTLKREAAIVPTARWQIHITLVPLHAEYTAKIDARTVDRQSLHIRSWEYGDKITPIGLGGHHKKVSDIFTDAKVPRAERINIPIICDKNGLIWIAGQMLSDRVKVTETTTQTLFLAVSAADQSD